MERIASSSEKSNRIFIGIDLLICSLWVLFVFRVWAACVLTGFCVPSATFGEWWTVPLALIIIAFRLGVSFMMLRDDRRGVWISLVLFAGAVATIDISRFVLLEAIKDAFSYLNMIGDWWLNPALRWFGHLVGLHSYNETIDVTWGILIFVWLWLMPLVYFLMPERKRVKSERSLLTVLTGFYLFKDPSGIKYLKMGAFVMMALLIGMVMDTMLSLVGLFVLSAVFYKVLLKKNPSNTGFKWPFMVIAMLAVWLAQYQTGLLRIFLLAICVLSTFMLATSISRGKGKIGKWMVVTLVAGVLLPSFILGYNVYAVTDCKRLEKLEAKYCLTGVLKVQDAQGQVGLRDRYRLIIPAQFSDIQDYELPYLKVRKDSLWGIWNTQYKGFVKGNFDHVYAGIDYSKSYEELCMQVKPVYAFLEPKAADGSTFWYKRQATDSLVSVGDLFNRN